MQYPCLMAATQWNVELHEIVEKLLEENNILRRIDISRGNIQKQFNCSDKAKNAGVFRFKVTFFRNPL